MASEVSVLDLIHFIDTPSEEVIQPLELEFVEKVFRIELVLVFSMAFNFDLFLFAATA